MSGYRKGKNHLNYDMFMKHCQQGKNSIMIGYNYVVIPLEKYKELIKNKEGK